MLQHEVGLTERREARIDQMGDVRVAETGEDVPFALETLGSGAADETHVQQLDGDLSFESAVAAPCQPDAAGSSVADLRNERVGSERLAGEGRQREAGGRPFCEESLPLQQVAFLEQCGQLRRQRRVVGSKGIQPDAALVLRHLQGTVQMGTHGSPALRAEPGHVSPPAQDASDLDR